MPVLVRYSQDYPPSATNPNGRLRGQVYEVPSAELAAIWHPDAVLALTGWASSGLGVVSSLVDGGVSYITDTRSSTSAIGINTLTGSHIPVTAGQSLTVSGLIRKFVGGAFSNQVRIRWYPQANAGGTLISEVVLSGVVPTSVDQFFSVSAVAPATTVSAMVTFLSATGTMAVGDVFGVRSLQFELKAYATSFARGDMGSGYSWSGTPHASSSVRANGYLSFTQSGRLNSIEGGFLCRFTRAYDNALIATLFQTGTTGVGNDMIGPRLDATDNMSAVMIANGSQISTPISGVCAVGVEYVGYVGWAGTSIEVWRSGLGAKSLYTRFSPTGTLPLNAYIGIDRNLQQAFDGRIRQVMMLDRRLTVPELARAVATPQWSFDMFADTDSVAGLLLPT